MNKEQYQMTEDEYKFFKDLNVYDKGKLNDFRKTFKNEINRKDTTEKRKIEIKVILRDLSTMML